MPAKSKAQQRLFGMALAVRRGDLKRDEVNDDVIDIVDSDMTNKEIEDFASTKHDGLKKYTEGMKSLYTYLDESKGLKESKDKIKNEIINYLKDFKIVWNVDSVDSALDEVTEKPYLADYLDKDDIKGADKIYWMKCWNDGFILNKSYPYTNAEIVSFKNNTDTKWFFIIKGKDVTVIRQTNGYYGQKDIKEEIHSFKLK